MIKKTLKFITPLFARRFYGNVVMSLTSYRNARRSTELVFTKVYEMNKWGGKRGEINSGSGSDEAVTRSYIELLSKWSTSFGSERLVLVDLGCGDFRVGRELRSSFRHYIGVDIVKPVIERNNKLYSNDSTVFFQLNIIEDELPDGDVCTIRQVLQHLSNDQIIKVISKVKKYRYVFITEHYPVDCEMIKPNINKIQGGNTRISYKSGVYLNEPPFNISVGSIEKILEVDLGVDSGGRAKGVVRTFLYRP